MIKYLIVIFLVAVVSKCICFAQAKNSISLSYTSSKKDGERIRTVNSVFFVQKQCDFQVESVTWSPYVGLDLDISMVLEDDRPYTLRKNTLALQNDLCYFSSGAIGPAIKFRVETPVLVNWSTQKGTLYMKESFANPLLVRISGGFEERTNVSTASCRLFVGWNAEYELSASVPPFSMPSYSAELQANISVNAIPRALMDAKNRWALSQQKAEFSWRTEVRIIIDIIDPVVLSVVTLYELFAGKQWKEQYYCSLTIGLALPF